MVNKYKTILADPPWPEYGGGKIKRGADRHYPLMSIEEIINLPVYNFSEDNCHLYLWATNNFLPQAFKVMEKWGFDYKTCITWAKPTFGLGQYFRGQSEHCLFGVKGNLPYKVVDGKRQQGRTIFSAPITKHSEKPKEMYEMIEKVSYEPRLELFARSKREGWDIWGNTLENDINLLQKPEIVGIDSL